MKKAKKIALGFRQDFNRIFEHAGYQNFGNQREIGNQSGNRKKYIKQQKSEKRKRVNCTFQPTEYSQLAKHAKKVGLAPTAFLKQASFAYISQGFIVPPETKAQLHEITILLRKAGNNLNQIARKTNFAKSATVFDLMKAKGVLREMEEGIERLLPSQISSPLPRGEGI